MAAENREERQPGSPLGEDPGAASPQPGGRPGSGDESRADNNSPSRPESRVGTRPTVSAGLVSSRGSRFQLGPGRARAMCRAEGGVAGRMGGEAVPSEAQSRSDGSFEDTEESADLGMGLTGAWALCRADVPLAPGQGWTQVRARLGTDLLGFLRCGSGGPLDGLMRVKC